MKIYPCMHLFLIVDFWRTWEDGIYFLSIYTPVNEPEWTTDAIKFTRGSTMCGNRNTATQVSLKCFLYPVSFFFFLLCSIIWASKRKQFNKKPNLLGEQIHIEKHILSTWDHLEFFSSQQDLSNFVGWGA